MINKLLFKLSARLPCRQIRVDGKPYLERYYLGQLFGATFYLHRFLSSDQERHTHNHPWGWGRALVLCGGYDEEVATDLTTSAAGGYLAETRRVRWWNRVDGSHFHRIANAKPGTWTLFAHGPRVMIDRGHVTQPKGWGFLSRSGNAVAYLPFPSAASEWWLTAPKGRDAGRVPLWGHAARRSGCGVGCASRQHSDMMACAPCGLRYDVNDPSPPRCPANLQSYVATPEVCAAVDSEILRHSQIVGRITRWKPKPRPAPAP